MPVRQPDSTERATGGGQEHVTARSIANIASKLFSERGYDATPVRAIAEEAGITCPTLYYHFKSKEGLAQELLSGPLAEVYRTVRGHLDDAALDPVERLARIAEAYLAFSRDDPERARFVYAVMFGPADRKLAEEVDGMLRRIQGLVVEAAGRLAAAGVIPRDGAGEFASALRGQIVIHTMDFLYRGGPLGPGLAGHLVARLLLGMAEPSARGPLSQRYSPAGGVPPGP